MQIQIENAWFDGQTHKLWQLTAESEIDGRTVLPGGIQRLQGVFPEGVFLRAENRSAAALAPWVATFGQPVLAAGGLDHAGVRGAKGFFPAC